MSISRVCLCLIFLTIVASPLVLCSRSPKLAAPSAVIGKKLGKGHVHSPAMLVSESPKYAPFPMGTPTNPSSPVSATPSSGSAAAEEEESEKVPSMPSKGNRDGGNA
ncbi:unnamed protein product [Arabidopsis arenosa]|uniref:Uncharacterized protein n=1 Tax=Arabidopsis arenosa TaxID=38785 RepID=A0A8S2AX72_ARAAE|nr:unnamed protein product [Arabidopsis arenosa]